MMIQIGGFDLRSIDRIGRGYSEEEEKEKEDPGGADDEASGRVAPVLPMPDR